MINRPLGEPGNPAMSYSQKDPERNITREKRTEGDDVYEKPEEKQPEGIKFW
jgi:hypothetical protein